MSYHSSLINELNNDNSGNKMSYRLREGRTVNCTSENLNTNVNSDRVRNVSEQNTAEVCTISKNTNINYQNTNENSQNNNNTNSQNNTTNRQNNIQTNINSNNINNKYIRNQIRNNSQNNRSSNDENNKSNVTERVIPNIIVSETPNYTEDLNSPFNIPLVIQKPETSNTKIKSKTSDNKTRTNKSVSFSFENEETTGNNSKNFTEQSKMNIPNIQFLLNCNSISNTSQENDSNSSLCNTDLNLYQESVSKEGDIANLTKSNESDSYQNNIELREENYDVSNLAVENRPALTDLLNASSKDSIQNSTSSIQDKASMNEFNIPNISKLLIQNSDSSLNSNDATKEINSNDSYSSSQDNTNIRASTSRIIPLTINFIQNQQNSLNSPSQPSSLLDELSFSNQESNTNNSSYLNLPQLLNSANSNSPAQSSSRTSCHSPLPNLSLNTLLPHFTFAELEIATNYFDETPHENNKPLNETKGRFLGKGGFGSVFLALGLLDKPVAVKKIRLDNENVVNIDDKVTKGFRNEVEILSKYKHENLVSILGYSCDGLTYCLVYDYVSGGSLKDRLMVSFRL